MKGDLHVHTNISDRSYSVEQTLIRAKQNNVTHIGVVNHDTVKGLEYAIEIGKKLGIVVIPGIEISAYDFNNNRKVHILGYNFDLKGKNIRKICDPLLKKRSDNSSLQINTLLDNGYELDLNYIREKSKLSEVVYKQHIMSALIKNNYTDTIYSSLYKKLFKNEGICASDIEYIDVFEAVNAIKNDGGLAVLAHPGQLNSYDIIPSLVAKGLDGIEINHHSHSKEDVKKVEEFNKKYGLILTGGTDFHGEYGEIAINLGNIVCPEEALIIL